MLLNRAVSLASLLALALALAAGSAQADEKQNATNKLPGVDTKYSIVKPVPEPDEKSQADVDADKKSVKVGNWDVEISGYVWYQVGASGSTGR